MLLKRSLSLLLCVLLVLSICVFSMPRTAKAAPTGVWVGGTAVTAGSFYLNDGAGGITAAGASDRNYNVRYDGGVLYLKDAFITKNKAWDNSTAAVYADSALTVSLTGRSILYGADKADGNSYGVYGFGNVTVQGGGTLIATGGATTASGSQTCGVRSSGGNVSVTEGGTLIATGGSTSCDSYGVYVESGGGVSIAGGTLIATGGMATASVGATAYSFGVSVNGSGGVEMTGGELIATGGKATDTSHGIFCSANGVNISGGTVIATGGAAPTSFGVTGFGANKIRITGGLTVARCDGTDKALDFSPSLDASMMCLTGAWDGKYAVYGEANTYAVIDADHKINVGGNNVSCLDYTASLVPADSSGHFTWDGHTLTLTNVIINAAEPSAIKLPDGATLSLQDASVVKGGDVGGSEVSCGVLANGALSIGGGGSLIAIGGTAGAESNGIRGNDSITLSGGTVTAIGGTANGTNSYSAGVRGGRDVNISAGALTAIGGTVSGSASYGVGCGGTVSASGGTLTALGGMGSGNTNSYGISCDDFAATGNADVLAKAGDAPQRESTGLEAVQTVSVSGGRVVGMGGKAGGVSNSCGVAGATVSIYDGELLAVGGASVNSSYGVASGTFMISGGRAFAAGGAATNSSYGVSGSASLTVSNGVVTAQGGAATNSYGLYSDAAITLTGGTITASGGKALSMSPTFSDAAQTNETWYMWESFTAPAEPTGGYKPAPYPYSDTHKYLKVTPAVAVAVKLSPRDNVVVELNCDYPYLVNNVPSAVGTLDDSDCTAWLDGSVLKVQELSLGGAGVMSNGISGGLYAVGDLTIELQGSNNIAVADKNEYSTTPAASVRAVWVDGGSLTLSGDGSLTVDVGTGYTNASGRSCAIACAKSGERRLTVGSNVTLTATIASNESLDTTAVYVSNLTNNGVILAESAKYGVHLCGTGGSSTSAGSLTSTSSGSEAMRLHSGHTFSVTGGTVELTSAPGSRAIGGTNDTAKLQIDVSMAQGLMGESKPTAAVYTSDFIKTNYYRSTNPVYAYLRLPAWIAITTQPTPQAVAAGNAATFTVVASGFPAPTYQWQVSTDGGATWRDVVNGTGGANASYTTPETTGSMNGYRYRCVVTNSAGSSTSDAATLTVSVPASGGVHSSAGGGADTGNQYAGSFSSGVNGVPVLTVQAPCDKCVSVTVDGVQLKENIDYIKVCGSTIITFTSSYLATLKDGTHTIRVQFTDGRYDGNFITPFTASIATTLMASVPATGDAPTWLFVLLLAGLALVIRRRRA